MDKKGSVTVLAMMFFVSLVSMMLIFIDVSKKTAVASAAGELTHLWCSSILGEYDRDLKDRYDIFGFRGMPPEVCEKIDGLAADSFDGKDYVEYGGSSCELYAYSLAATEAFKKQVVYVGGLCAAGSLLPGSGGAGSSGSGNMENAEITASAVLDSLPSAGSSGGISLEGLKEAVKNLGSLSDVIKLGTDKFFENKYIFSYFKSKTDDHGVGETWFRNEIEYIICGKKSDQGNEKGVKTRIIAIREVMNMLYIMQDPEMEEITLAAAEILTPGAAAPVTQKLLEAAWALAESNNDYKLLVNGKKVPAMKDKDSWAIDLESIVKGGLNVNASGQHGTEADGGMPEILPGSDGENELPELKEEVAYVDPGNGTGDTYDDYLAFMTYVMGEDIKLLRMMDLIQIDIRYTKNGGFLIQEHNAGLSMKISVNGEIYEAEKEYIKS